jgi:hypothetical protein
MNSAFFVANRNNEVAKEREWVRVKMTRKGQTSMVSDRDLAIGEKMNPGMLQYARGASKLKAKSLGQTCRTNNVPPYNHFKMSW